MKKPLCPPNCKFRKLGCHSACEHYLNARKELDELNAKIRKEKDLSHAIKSTRTNIAKIAIRKKEEHNV